MTKVATLNTSNKNTNNCGRLKHILRTKQNKYYCLNIRNIRNQQSKTNTNLNFQEREREREREREIQIKRSSILFDILSVDFCHACADWSKTCLPPAEIERVLTSSMSPTCFRPAGENCEDMPHANHTAGLRNIAWLSTLIKSTARHRRATLIFTSHVSQYCAHQTSPPDVGRRSWGGDWRGGTLGTHER